MKHVNAINYREAWTDEQDQELLRRVAAGATDLEIADAMGRTRVGVINRRGRLGIAHGQPCSRKRDVSIDLMSAAVVFENITRAEARLIQDWAMCPDYEYPNVNILKITGVPNDK